MKPYPDQFTPWQPTANVLPDVKDSAASYIIMQVKVIPVVQAMARNATKRTGG